MLRGITGVEAELMLAEEIPPLGDPYLMEDMDTAVDLLLPLIERGARVLVHGDYDTDGVTSTAILLRSLRRLGLEVTAYIPNRLTDGYGLAEGGVLAAKAEAVDLLITCDCGVQSFAEVDSLREAGIDVLITDHHSCLPELPRANAVVNPNRLDDSSPYADLSGAGVALKLVQALAIRLDREDLWQDVVDLAALGTVGDSMQLIGENRSIVRMGIQKLRHAPLCGLLALMRSVKIESTLCVASDLAYKLSPKVNAAGRLGDSATALDLLLTDTEEEATRLATELLKQNNDRKEIEAEAVTEALAELQAHPDCLEHKGVVVSLKNGHAGVMGIIAQRLTERLACPVVALMRDEESDPGKPFWRGSARAYGDHSVLDLIRAASAHCKQFGGHHAAAGVEIELDQLKAFRRAFLAAADAVTNEEMQGEEAYYEFELTPEDCTLEHAYDLARLEPFGEGNPEPYFLLRDAEIREHWLIGQDKRHLRLGLSIGGSPSLPAIYFSAASKLAADTQRADFLVRLQVNHFRGQENLQLFVEGHALSDAVTQSSFASDPLQAEQELLYSRYGEWSGVELAAILGADVEDLAPKRDVLANLYRYLMGRLAGAPERLGVGELTNVLQSMYNIETNHFHIRRTLDMYHEAGLIALRVINRNEYLLGLKPAMGKADLYGTPTWKRLQAN